MPGPTRSAKWVKPLLTAAAVIAVAASLLTYNHHLRRRPNLMEKIQGVRAGMTKAEVEDLVGSPTFQIETFVGPRAEDWVWTQLPVGNELARISFDDAGVVFAVVRTE